MPTATETATPAPTPTVRPGLPPVLASADDDADGVRNADDACPRTVPGERVVLRGCTAAELLSGADALPELVGGRAAGVRKDVGQLGWLKSRTSARLQDVQQAFSSAQAKLVAGDGCGASKIAGTGRSAARSASDALVKGIKQREQAFRQRRTAAEIDPELTKGALVRSDLEATAAAASQAANGLKAVCKRIVEPDRTVTGTITSMDALHNRIVVDGVDVSIAGSSGGQPIAPGAKVTVEGAMLEGGVLAAETVTQVDLPDPPALADCVTPKFVPRTAIPSTPGTPLLALDLAGYDGGVRYFLEEGMGVSATASLLCPRTAPGFGFFRYGVTVLASWRQDGVWHQDEVLGSTFEGEPLPAIIPRTDPAQEGVIQFVEWQAKCVASPTDCGSVTELDRHTRTFTSRKPGGWATLDLGGGLSERVYAVEDRPNRSDSSGVIDGWEPATNLTFSGFVEAFGRTITNNKTGPVGPLYEGDRVGIVDDPHGGIEAARVFGGRNGSEFVYDAARPTLITDGIRKCGGSDRVVYLRMPWVQRKDWERVTQGYDGEFTHENDFALDLVMQNNEPIFAARGGTVEEVIDWRSGNSHPQKVEDGEEPKALANRLVIKHRDGTTATYAHMPKKGIYVNDDDTVRRGELVARVGNTGNSTGPHLHIELSYDARWEYRREDGKFIACGIPKGETDAKTTNYKP